MRAIRKARKLTLGQVAQKSGHDGSYLSRLETGGKKNPSSDIVASVSRGLGCPEGELFSDDGTGGWMVPVSETAGVWGIKDEMGYYIQAASPDLVREIREVLRLCERFHRLPPHLCGLLRVVRELAATSAGIAGKEE